MSSEELGGNNWMNYKELEKFKKRRNGLVYVFTGDGAGKTTAALGLGLRALGHGKEVIVVQFLKGRKDVGEYQVQSMLRSYEVYQFGREQFVDLKNPDKMDFELAKQGFKFAKEALKRGPGVLILDEINVAVYAGLIKVKDVIELMKYVPKDTLLILTGRYASEEIIEKADLVSEVKKIKHPFDFGSVTRNEA